MNFLKSLLLFIFLISNLIWPSYGQVSEPEFISINGQTSLIVDGNDFTLTVTKVPFQKIKGTVSDKTIKTGGLFSSINGDITGYDQSDIGSFEEIFDIKKILPDLNIVSTNYGGVRKVFEFQSNLFALLPMVKRDQLQNPKCFFVSLINLTEKKEVFRGPCLPDLPNNDFNAIGGGHAEINGNLLLAFGAPDALGAVTPFLAQDNLSPYGKVLFFTKDDLIDSPPLHYYREIVNFPYILLGTEIHRECSIWMGIYIWLSMALRVVMK